MEDFGGTYMKSFFYPFKESAAEMKKISCIAITGMFVAISMAIESFTIELPFARINFAFLAIAVIGMLYGPTVAFIAGGLCDIVGFIVHPSTMFLPAYILVAMLEGFIFGYILYRKSNNMRFVIKNRKTQKDVDITLYIKLIFARLIDIIVINLLLNTALNLHYGFIPKQAYGTAIIARTAKNVIELVADIPLLFIILPAILLVFERTVVKSKARV